jgi:putative ABC transport system substrate-binding protein
MANLPPTPAIELIAKQISDDAADIERAIEAFARMPEGGLLIVLDSTIIAHSDLVISRAARYSLPAVYPWRFFVTAGALMSYGIDNIDGLQKAASYVDRILRGAKPVDLPVQAPTKLERLSPSRPPRPSDSLSPNRCSRLRIR